MEFDQDPEMLQLQKEFRESFRERMEILEGLRDRLDRREDIERVYHRLHGCGKTYGFPEISQIFFVLEQTVFTLSDDQLKVGMELAVEVLKTGLESGNLSHFLVDQRFVQLQSLVSTEQ